MNRSLVSLFPLLALASVACASGPDGETTNDDITDVAHSSVKDEAIGNCWVYASTGWAESLHLRYSGEELNLSESWMSYVDWFHGIQNGDIDAKGEVQTGGWFGEGQDWMSRYGALDESFFIPGDENTQASRRQADALSAINASIKSGVLSDPAKRRDPAVVRDELDKAWRLEANVISAIDATFGRTLAEDFLTGAKVPDGVTGIHAPTSITVGFVPSTQREISLADAAGTARSSFNPTSRSGTYAWNETRYPTTPAARRQFQIQMQRALHQSLPVGISWYVDFNSMHNGEFHEPPTTPGYGGGHVSLLEDYQIGNVPGFGTLKAGTLVTDPAALAAALSPEATLEFVRIKNSWSTTYQNLNLPAEELEKLAGYHDIYTTYLESELQTCDTKDAAGKCTGRVADGLTGMVFPPDSWNEVTIKAPTPEQETCDGQLTINEVQVAGANASDEFVEIYNASNCEVPFLPYKLVYRSRTGTASTVLYDGNGTIPAHGYLLLAHARYDGAGTPLPFRAGGLATAGQLAILTDEGTVVDSMGYGAAGGTFVSGKPAAAPPANQSSGRKTDGVSTHDNSADFQTFATPTPGASNR